MVNREETFAEEKDRLRELFSLVSFPNSPEKVGDLPLAILAYTENIVSLGAESGLEHLVDDTTPYVSLAQLAYSDRFDLHRYLRLIEDAEIKQDRRYVLDGISKSPYLVPFLVDRDLYGKIEKHFLWYGSFRNRSSSSVSDATIDFSNRAVSSSFYLRDQVGNCEELVLELATLRRPFLDVSKATIFDVYSKVTSSKISSSIRSMSLVAPFSAIAVHNDAIDEGDELRRMMAVWYIQHLSELGNLGGAMDRLIGSPLWFDMAASDRSAQDIYSRLSRNWSSGCNYREKLLNDGCWKHEARVPTEVWSQRYVDLMCRLAKKIDETSLRELRKSIISS